MDQKRGFISHKETDAKKVVAKNKLIAVFNARDYLIVIAESVALSALIAYGFFDSVYGMFFVIPIGVINLKRYRLKKNEMRCERIRQEFKEILLSVASLLQAGYSVENAFFDVVEVLENLYGKGSVLHDDMTEMNRQIRMHVSVEKAFMNIARQYPIEEIESFGEIFLYTKRLGGGYAKNLKDTADRLEERINMKEELNAMISQKKLELSIMSVMPMAIVLYMKLSGGSFMAPLYHNLTGISVMAASLCIYAGSVALGVYMINKVMNEI